MPGGLHARLCHALLIYIYICCFITNFCTLSFHILRKLRRVVETWLLWQHIYFICIFTMHFNHIYHSVIKMVTVRQLEFTKVRIFHGLQGLGANVYSTPNFIESVKWSLRCRDILISKMADDRHLGFVRRVFGSLTYTRWWFIALCKIWLQSLQ